MKGDRCTQLRILLRRPGPPRSYSCGRAHDLGIGGVYCMMKERKGMSGVGGNKSASSESDDGGGAYRSEVCHRHLRRIATCQREHPWLPRSCRRLSRAIHPARRTSRRSQPTPLVSPPSMPPKSSVQRAPRGTSLLLRLPHMFCQRCVRVCAYTTSCAN